MVRPRPTLPAGHGELVTRPDVSEWASLADLNHQAAQGWTFSVAGMPAQHLRRLARAEATAAADAFSARLGIPVAPSGPPEGLVIMTGHQPELYHPGVWVKDFLLARVAREAGATAIDVVVDSDGFDALSVTSPCMLPGVQRCRQYLAVGGGDTCYAQTPVPPAEHLDDFCRGGAQMLGSLPAPAIGKHFATFCDCLRDAASDADNLAELVTIARRRYEATAGTDYLELPLTALVQGEAFARFVVHIASDAAGFATAFNAELAAYREATKTRSAAQPFPDLAVGADGVELPLWWLKDSSRRAVRARRSGDGVELFSGEDRICVLSADAETAVCDLRGCGAILAPKALALTMFIRLFVADLFIHGIGGGRYDRVTDGVISRYFAVTPPPFAVASLTMYLPLGAHVVSDDEVAGAKERLNRLEHNPDALLSEVDFDSAEEQGRALALAAEKARLVAEIARPDADKKALGARIRTVNAELAELLAPLRAALEAEVQGLEQQRAASEILTDRTYPFCFWSPQEIADKVSW